MLLFIMINTYKDVSMLDKITKGKIIFAILLILGITLIGVFAIKSNDPSVVVKSFIEKSQERDWDGTKELWSESGKVNLLSKVGNDERWIQQTAKNLTHRTYGNLDDYKITDTDIEDDKATVQANFTFENGKQEKVNFAVVKEDGDWKIFAFGTMY